MIQEPRLIRRREEYEKTEAYRQALNGCMKRSKKIRTILYNGGVDHRP